MFAITIGLLDLGRNLETLRGTVRSVNFATAMEFEFQITKRKDASLRLRDDDMIYDTGIRLRSDDL
jgi:hypothetical protein